jgi:DNA transformation protein
LHRTPRLDENFEMRLEDTINIGDALAAELRQVGIEDREALCAAGAAEAWDRLYEAGLRDCVSSRLALEGAVRGVRWSQLPAGLRADLSHDVRARVAQGQRV